MTSDLHHLAAAYALDALEPDERADFEAHFRECDACIAEAASFQDVAAELGRTAETPPPAHLFASIMDEVEGTPQLESESPEVRSPLRGIDGGAPATTAPSTSATSSGVPWRNMLAIAAAVSAFVIGGFLLRGSLAADPVAELASSDDAISAQLAVTVDGQEGEIEIWWSAERDEVAVVASDLADLSDDEVYALWFLVDDGVAPAALFRPDNGSVETVLDVDDLTANGWGITIEPAGGSDQPTSDVIFAGAL